MNYSEEEKEAIERFKRKIKRADIDIMKFSDVYTTLDIHNLRILLNLIQKQSKVIDKMAEEILKIDTAKSKFEYDHAKVWDTEKGIKEYFEKVVDEDVKD